MKKTKTFGIIACAAIIVFSMAGCAQPSDPVITPPILPAAMPVIGVQPANTAWNVTADNVITLMVTASVTDGGVISYQWYKSASNSAAGGTAINGQTSATITLNKTGYGTNGDYYFYVVVMNTNNNVAGAKTAVTTSAVATVTVTGGAAPPASAVTPFIGVQPANTAWNVTADNVKTLTVAASVTDGGVISYQWYKSASNSAAGGTAISGQTNATLSLAKADYSTNGDYYFYVVVTNTNNNAVTTKTVSVSSAVATVTVIGNGGYLGILNLAFTLINDAAYEVSKGTSTATVVIIPAVHNGLPVTKIADDGFMNYTVMTSIVIPNSVTSIGDGAFSGCSSLTSISVAGDNTAFASQDGILYNKTKTSIAMVPQGISGSVIIPAGVTFIGPYVFSCPGLTSVTIPSSVEMIFMMAFTNCSGLTSVTFGGTIASSRFGLGIGGLPPGFPSFLGDLRAKFYATDSTNGTPGTYTTTAPVNSYSVWTKQP